MLLRKKGINLDTDNLGNYLESWRQLMLDLIRENTFQQKRIRELEKNSKKKKKKKTNNSLSHKSRNKLVHA